MSAKKRPRTEADESGAECPFRVRQRAPTPKELARFQEMKSRRETIEEDRKGAWQWQVSPFAAAGFAKEPDSMNVKFTVDPVARWSEMTRYNSFVLGKEKFQTDDYVFVANEDSVKRQKTGDAGTNGAASRRANSDWVARILEIRALDELHVYARVYWMYWPDELPANTQVGGKVIRGGRQPYHGKHELVASNHMDVINAVSVTVHAQVNHWVETDEEDSQDSLYWRQALNCNTSRLSVARETCRCAMPAHPDKILIRCSNSECGQWMHDDCLQHDVLMRVYKRLGKTEPQTMEGMKAPAVEPKKEDGDTKDGLVSPPATDTEKAEGGDDKSSSVQDGKLPLFVASGPSPWQPMSTKGAGKEPYRGLFEASLRLDDGPTTWRIRDLRSDVKGGEKMWLEEAFCFFCSKKID